MNSSRHGAHLTTKLPIRKTPPRPLDEILATLELDVARAVTEVLLDHTVKRPGTRTPGVSADRDKRSDN